MWNSSETLRPSVTLLCLHNVCYEIVNDFLALLSEDACHFPISLMCPLLLFLSCGYMFIEKWTGFQRAFADWGMEQKPWSSLIAGSDSSNLLNRRYRNTSAWEVHLSSWCSSDFYMHSGHYPSWTATSLTMSFLVNFQNEHSPRASFSVFPKSFLTFSIKASV